MKKFLFSSKTIRALIVVGAVAAVPVASAAASTPPSTTIFASAQGTSLLGQEIPVLGTQGWYITLPVKSTIAPQIVWDALDFTVISDVQVGNTQVAYLWVDPHLAR